MRKICLIRQPAGLGDIFFCQKIAHHFNEMGYEIIWPIKTDFYYLQSYLNNDSITYIPDNLSFPYKDLYTNMSIKEPVTDKDKTFIFLPLHGGVLTDDSVMISKYNSVRLDWKDWKKYFEFKRNLYKEDILYRVILGLREDEEYNFVNNMFASPPDIQYKEISDINNQYKNITMKMHDGITLFDWCKVIEKAKNIYTVETSLNYIIEKLSIEAERGGEMRMYSKWNPPDFHHIKPLFNKNWKYGE